MATKLTKFNTLKCKKTLAIILAIICFFSVGFSVCFLVREKIFYDDYGSYENTASFRTNLNYIELWALSDGEMQTCKSEADFEKTSVGKTVLKNKTAAEKQIRDACDYLDSLDSFYIYVSADNEYRYLLDMNGTKVYFAHYGIIDADDFNSHTYLSVSQNKAEKSKAPAQVNTSKIASCLALIHDKVYDTNGYHYDYGEETTDRLIEIFTGSYEQNYGYNSYNFWFRSSEIEEKCDCVKFALFCNTTKKVYTNCGVKWDDNLEAVQKKLGGEYVEYIENGKFYSNINLKDNGIWTKLNSEFTGLQENCWLKGQVNNKNFSRIYFSYSKPVKDNDLFAVGLSGYTAENDIRSIIPFHGLVLTPAFCVITFIIALLCLAYVFAKAGKTENGEIKALFCDKIPFALSLALTITVLALAGTGVGALHYCEFNFAQEICDNYYAPTIFSFFVKNAVVLCGLLVVIFFMTLAAFICGIIRNVRNKTFLKHTLIAYIILLFKQICKGLKFIYRKTLANVFRGIKEFIIDDYSSRKGKATKIISIAVIFIIANINFILIALYGSCDVDFVFPFILTVLVVAALIWLLICFDRLARGISQIKLGNFTVEINKKYMPAFMKAVAENICSVRDGLSDAVCDALKQQATKTELITNVTHDLKTPLTSIITYIDLLKKDENGEHRDEYIGIIDEKSQKLKKLIDDLVQASKAAGGAIDVHPVSLDLSQFAVQTAGENEDELKENGIELVLKAQSTPVTVKCDPGLTGRVFENLISNIRKYAMKGTRAFIEVKEDEGFGIIVFKNISAAPIDVEPERLTERFFRADSSRTGDGSGLGLSIAENLTTVQGGSFNIEIDGDYFKVYIKLPKQ